MTAGLLLSVLSGNWCNIGVPIPLDRIVIVDRDRHRAWSDRCGADDERIEIRGVHWLMLLLVLYAIASAAWSNTLTEHAPLFALLDRLGVVPFLLYLVAPVAVPNRPPAPHPGDWAAVAWRLPRLDHAVRGGGATAGSWFPQYILTPTSAFTPDAGEARSWRRAPTGSRCSPALVAAAITLSWWRDRRVRAAVRA